VIHLFVEKKKKKTRKSGLSPVDHGDGKRRRVELSYGTFKPDQQEEEETGSLQ
jgi:hypothetical protein